jgi:hypothetical protein
MPVRWIGPGAAVLAVKECQSRRLDAHRWRDVAIFSDLRTGVERIEETLTGFRVRLSRRAPLPVVTVWLIPSEGTVPRLITAYPVSAP